MNLPLGYPQNTREDFYTSTVTQYKTKPVTKHLKGNHPTAFLFEIEKITVKIFTNKAREVNKGLLGMY